jgi:hypothetical protein
MVEVIDSFSIERIISYLLCQGEYIYYKKRMYNILYSNAVRPVMCWSWNFPTIRHTKSWGLDSLNELNTSTFYWSVSIKPGKCVYCICVFGKQNTTQYRNSFKPENRGGGKFDTQKNNSMSEQFQPKNRGGGKLNTQNTHIQYTHFPGLIETLQ